MRIKLGKTIYSYLAYPAAEGDLAYPVFLYA